MKKFIINLLLVFFIGVLLYSGYNLFKIFCAFYLFISFYGARLVFSVLFFPYSAPFWVLRPFWAFLPLAQGPLLILQ